ncbi:MAG: threonine transporter RhtB [Stappia sp.]|uniref:LysE family translocator n=1 Tax=Stappia sp. TaxID=1870903 RepID=UPI000C43CA28|nr:LysE family translocator [Stappia sp.]MAA99278.1 threonine transporter RhtB [Stappia sp.]MBM20154.1 threonine transporter RhtB [Stappia sp.]
MSFIPDAATLAAFTAAVLVLVMTPGPDMTLFVSRALTQGRASGLVSVLGTSTGSVVHTLLVAFGLSALLAASAEAFLVLKVVGALYLLWLAYQGLRHGSALSVAARADTPRVPLGRVYLTGLLVNLLNPKIVLFFLTFLPQFVAANDPDAAGKLVFLGLYLVVLSVPFCVAMVLMAEGFSKGLRRSPRLMRAIDWLFAGVIGGFAVKILMTSRG